MATDRSEPQSGHSTGDWILLAVGILAGLLAVRDAIMLVREGYAHANALPLVGRLGIPLLLASGGLSGHRYHRIGMLAIAVCALIQLNISAWHLGIPGAAACFVSAAVVVWSSIRRPAGERSLSEAE